MRGRPWFDEPCVCGFAGGAEVVMFGSWKSGSVYRYVFKSSVGDVILEFESSRESLRYLSEENSPAPDLR